jgi:hypothetical protein
MDFKKMELSELASLVKVSLKEPGIGKFIIESKLVFFPIEYLSVE